MKVLAGAFIIIAEKIKLPKVELSKVQELDLSFLYANLSQPQILALIRL